MRRTSHLSVTGKDFDSSGAQRSQVACLKLASPGGLSPRAEDCKFHAVACGFPRSVLQRASRRRSRASGGF